MLRDTFNALVDNYTSDVKLKQELREEIELCYTNKNRHYHSLLHLENLLQQLTEVRLLIKDWNTVLFTLFYHDIVYNPLKHNNEDESAEFANKRMLLLAVPENIIRNCKQQILATKQHLPNQDTDTNFFTDADLSILGANWGAYQTYSKQVRKEYSIYPDIVYKPGRKKVLLHFLEMDQIFKTPHFITKFEPQARLNLRKELEEL